MSGTGGTTHWVEVVVVVVVVVEVKVVWWWRWRWEGGERVDCWPNKTGVDTKSDRQCGGIQKAHRPVPPPREVPGQHVRVQDRPGDCWRWARVGP